MGQYHKIANLDKKEFLHPHKFGDGLKLLEFGSSGCGTMTGLAILLAAHNNRGGGDLSSTNPIIGSWAGDRIAVVGDYGNEPGDKCLGVYDQLDSDEWTDISERVIEAMCEDAYLRQSFKESGVI